MQTDVVTIGELWDRRAARDPAHVYCRFEDRDWTVGELDERINRLANALLAQGLVKGDRVALMLPSHPDHIVAIFALAKAGLVRVPVNVHLKGASLDFVFDRFEPRAIIADRAYSEVLAPIVGRLPGLKVVWRGTDAPADFAAIIDAASPARPAVSVMADDIIAITPSSGTTGEPKGVLKTDRSLRAGPMGTLALTGARSGDVLLLWEPLHHGAGVAVLIAAVMEPLTLAMVEKFSASRFWDQVRRYDVTHIHYLGGILQILLKQRPSPRDRDHGVRIAWGGGCPADIWPQFRKRFGVDIRECYGMTEASSLTTCNLSGVVGSVGTPMPWFTVRLDDAEGRPVPAGARGEIVIETSVPGAIFPGYLDNSDATAKALRPDGFHTGDLGSFDPQGNLYFHGRMTDSVRCRGENVSAWEVEHVAAEHEAVEDCAMIGVAADVGEQDIKLFVKPRAGASIDPQVLSGWLGQRLAPYQNPRYIAVVDEFERTASQRIMKHRLSPRLDDCWDRAAMALER